MYNIIDICNVNIQSLSDGKIDAIKAELMLNFDIICLTETNLPHARVTDFDLSGFHDILHKDRVGRPGGGVALYTAEHLGINHLYKYEIPELEEMWVKVKAGNNVFHLCVCYRLLNSGVDFRTKLQDSVDLVKQSGNNTIILTGNF